MAASAPAVKRDEDLEDRIIREFSSRARRNGPKAVVMADLARDLQISTKTLYRLFPTKADLVHRMMKAWARRFERDLDAAGEDELEVERDEGMPFVGQLVASSRVWQVSRRRFAGSFWEELERDYPVSFELFVGARARLRRQILERLEPHMAHGVDPEFAMELFDAALGRALDPDVLARTGVQPRAAIGQAVRIWAAGALVQPLRRRSS
jgi:AcrR family transcriptional regulator